MRLPGLLASALLATVGLLPASAQQAPVATIAAGATPPVAEPAAKPAAAEAPTQPVAPAAAPLATPAAGPAPAQASFSKEDREALEAFIGMQLLISECAFKVPAHDASRLRKVLALMEKGSGLPQPELAQIKGKVFTQIQTDQQKACAEGRIQVATLGPILDEMNTQLGGILGDAPARPQAAAAARVTGFAAIQALVGNTITARVNGVTYTDHILPDGTLRNLEDSTLSVGKWTAEGGRYCTLYKSYPKVCYTIEVAGSDVTLTEASGQGWRYTLTPGNPNRL